MKKKLKIFFISMLCFIVIGIQITFLGLGIYILDGLTYLYRHPGLLSEGTVRANYELLEVEVLKIEDDILIIKPLKDYKNIEKERFIRFRDKGLYLSLEDILAVNLDETIVKCDLEVGKVIYVKYRFKDGYRGKSPKYLNNVEYINDKQE